MNRCSVEQIIATAEQHELCTPMGEVIREPGVAEVLCSRWKLRCGELDPDQVREPT